MLQPPPVVATELHPPPPPPVLLVASALTLLPDFFRKIPFSGDFFLHARLLTVAALFPDNLPMSITSRVSLDGLRRPPELETPLTPVLNFNFKRDLKPCAAELIAVDEDADDDVSVVPFDGGTQPRFLLLVLLMLLLLLFITESSLVLTPTDRHVLGGLG